MFEITALLKKAIPFELKRSTSFISIILTIVVVGFLSKIGEWLFEKIVLILQFAFPFIKNFYSWATSTTYQISLLAIIFYILAFIILIFPIYRKFDKFFMQGKNKELIFRDDFNTNQGWQMNYWGTNNPEKTNRIENSTMIFEAREDELQNANKEFGAYYDLKNGIYEGYTYQICCKVKSDPDTTMKFQLWLHDNVVGNRSSMRTEKSPKEMETPSNEFREIKTNFIATATNGIRIHLHNKGGLGRIYVKEVAVYKAS